MHLLYLIVRYFHGMKLSRRYSREFILYSKFLDSKSKCQKLTTVKPRCLGHSCSLRTLYSSDSDNLQETANKAKFLRKQKFLWNRVWIKIMMLLCKQERKMNIWWVVKAYLVNRTFFFFWDLFSFDIYKSQDSRGRWRQVLSTLFHFFP